MQHVIYEQSDNILSTLLNQCYMQSTDLQTTPYRHCVGVTVLSAAQTWTS